jgi:hypothetical protein
VAEYTDSQEFKKRTWYNADGSIRYYDEWVYDASGNFVVRNRYDAGGTLTESFDTK